MNKKTVNERVAVCETEIVNLKNSVNRVCITDIPQIYDKLETLSNFSTETRSFFKLIAQNSDTLKDFDNKLDTITLSLRSLTNQEKLGKKEKASIIVAVIASLGGAAVALLTS